LFDVVRRLKIKRVRWGELLKYDFLNGRLSTSAVVYVSFEPEEEVCSEAIDLLIPMNNSFGLPLLLEGATCGSP
jgi:hypothetical protein